MFSLFRVTEALNDFFIVLDCNLVGSHHNPIFGQEYIRHLLLHEECKVLALKKCDSALCISCMVFEGLLSFMGC